MKFSVLASGSKGNSTFIETNETKVLIDLGMSSLYIEKKLFCLGINPSEINAIFITHTHVDHIAGLKVFLKKYKTKVYLTNKMYEELKDIVNNYCIINEDVSINDLEVKTFKTSHDASDSLGFILKNNNQELVYITDTGYINSKNHELLKNKDCYIIESNHDVSMLMNNPHYPHHIKIRILSDKGHLSNIDSANYMNIFFGEKTKQVVLIHLSENNNTKELAYSTMRDKLNENIKITISSQDEETELLEV